MLKNKFKFFLILIFIPLFSSGCALVKNNQESKAAITNFAGCAANIRSWNRIRANAIRLMAGILSRN
jgi:hypothetical protein